MTDSTRKSPFPFASDTSAFNRQRAEALRRVLSEMRSQMVSPENERRFHHGLQMQSHNSAYPDEVTTLQQHEQIFSIPFESIIKGDLGLIDRTLMEVSTGMHESFVRSLFTMLSAACDRSGNIVSSSALSPAEQFIEAIRTIEFGVDRHGNVSLPSFHVGSAAFEAIRRDVESKGPEFRAEIQRIMEEKSASALRQEADRLSRFLKTNDE